MSKHRQHGLKICKWLVPGVGFLALMACGGGKSTENGGLPLPTIINNGYFVDAAVEGIQYSSGTASGTTGANGEMQYQVGKTFEARLGNVLIGKTLGAEVITPVDFISGKHTGDATVQNISRFLVYLDYDNNMVNGIQISSYLQQAATDWTVRFQSQYFVSDIDRDVTPDVLAENLNANALVDSGTIQKHLNASIACAYTGAYSGTYSQTDGTANNGEWRFFLKPDGTILALTKTPSTVYRHTGTILYDATNARNLKPIYFDSATGQPVLDVNTGNPTFDLSTNIPVIRSDHSAELRFDNTQALDAIGVNLSFVYSASLDATHRYEFDSNSTENGIVISGNWNADYGIDGATVSQKGIFLGSSVRTTLDPNTYPTTDWTYYRGILETGSMLGEIQIAVQRTTGNIVARALEVTVTGQLDASQFVDTVSGYTGNANNITTDANGIITAASVTINGNDLILSSSNPLDPLGSTIITGNWGADGKLTACRETILPTP